MSKNKLTLDDFEKEQDLTLDDFEKELSLNSEQQERSLLDKASEYIPSEETMSDVLTGTQQGLTFGFSDELSGALSAALDKAGGLDEGQDFKALYKKYRDIERQKIKEAEERSPNAMITGEVVGAIIPAIATGGTSLFGSLGKTGLKEALKKGGIKGLMKAMGGKVALGGAEGTVTGALTGAGKAEEMENVIPEAYESAKSGAAFGSGIGLLGAGAEGAKIGIQKVGQFADEVIKARHFTRQLQSLESRAASGKPISLTQTGKETIEKESVEQISEFTNKILNADKQYGQRISSLIDDATQKGSKIKIDPALDQSTTQLKKILSENPNLIGERDFQKLVDELYYLQSSEMSPTAAKQLRDNINKLSEKLDIPNLRPIANDFQKNLKSLMEAQVPGLKEATDQFKNFRESVPEVLLGKGKLTEFSDNWFGSIKNKEQKLSDAVDNLFQTLTASGTKSRDAQRVLNDLKSKLSKNPEMVKSLGFANIDDFITNIYKSSDKEAIANALIMQHPDAGFIREASAALTAGYGTTAKGAAYGLANLTGIARGGVQRTASKITQPVANLSRKVFRASDETLRSFADSLKNTPGLQKLGDVLINALDNKGAVAKNAALFTLMQNPDARRVMEDFDFGFDTEED